MCTAPVAPEPLVLEGSDGALLLLLELGAATVVREVEEDLPPPDDDDLEVPADADALERCVAAACAAWRFSAARSSWNQG